MSLQMKIDNIKLAINSSAFFWLVTLIASCGTDKKIDYAILKGTISNTSSSYITVKNDSFSYDIDVNSMGEFMDTIQIERGFYRFFSGKERTSIFLDQGFNISLTLDQNQFDETLTFGSDQGKGNKINNYLAEKVRTEEEIMTDFTSTYSLNEDEFLDLISSLDQRQTENLTAFELNDDQFVSAEKRDLEYNRLSKLINYKGYHIYLTKERSFDTSEAFKENTVFDYSNEIDFKELASYRGLIADFFSNMIEEGDVKNTFKIIKEIKSNYIKSELAPKFKREITPGNAKSEDIFFGIKSISSDSSLIAELSAKMEVIRKLNIGMESPSFDYENIKGGTTSLSDLKGKYIYIDIWATWCGPCIREIPALKRLEKEFHNENIEFLSISIDKAKDHEKWIQMIEEKSLSGTQLFADKDWKSDFIKAYLIESIPRFLIIDPNGNILDTNADRPSDPELRTTLKDLLST